MFKPGKKWHYNFDAKIDPDPKRMRHDPPHMGLVNKYFCFSKTLVTLISERGINYPQL